MKSLKKENNEFACEICNAKYKNLQALSKHIKLKHDEIKYYNEFLKDKNEGICKICGNVTEKIPKFFSGYKNCCSKECDKKYNLIRTQEEIKKRYGVQNVFCLENVKNKIKKTFKEKYGVEFILQNEEIKNKVNKKRK